ncbi:TetR/AcrR family transcriptional regulator [Shouchella patagoniensis]|uniref:TetR/AcrR family transcriptional regulator n=1 Tax=Shouchella patagoniensis TaxID=228576 RepID=UPI0009959A31|nr:TetR/AcrR family transcriptional regulator [Shouchella patagoniensis]
MEKKMDPRIIRTRKLIMDSFIQLSTKKSLKELTIKDITDEATVNRATFYYHFNDKYDLLEKVLKEDLMTNVIQEIDQQDQLDHETITAIFLSITSFQTSLASRCKRSFEEFTSSIETVIKKELEQAFYRILLAQHPDQDKQSLRIGAVMLSWGIYGAAVDWREHSDTAPEEYIKVVVPYMTGEIALKP